MKVLLISTLAYNPGDEFIRLGQEYLLNQLLPAAEIATIHKHDPRTIFEGFRQRERLPHRRLIAPLYRLYANFGRHRKRDRLASADLVVFAGTPFIWRGNTWLFPSTSANAEWVGATWRRLAFDYPEKPVLNLAAGTSAGTPMQLRRALTDRKVVSFLKMAVRRSAVTTVRDRYAQDLLREIGFEVPLLPCTSILAARGAGLLPQEAEYVVVNVMPAAVHIARGHQIDATRWIDTIQTVVPEIEKRHKVLLVAHSADEDHLAASLFPGRDRLFSKDPLVLLKAYSKSFFGICNRVHSAAAIAAFGRPVILVGGDTRIDVIRQFGMPALDHREIGASELLEAVNDLESHYDRYAQKLEESAALTSREHMERIRSALRLNSSMGADDSSAGSRPLPVPVTAGARG